MKNKRRDFLKLTGMTGLGLATGGLSNVFSATVNNSSAMEDHLPLKNALVEDKNSSVIGAYGKWAAGLTENKLPSLSFRKKEFTNQDAWKKDARKRLTERLAIPEIGGMPAVTVKKQYEYDGLHIEELSWQLPYGAATEGILLKPVNAKGKLPGILAFHDHGGVKYFGTRKITRTADKIHPLMEEHQKDYYEGFAWANEVAKRGYVVLVSDAFPFASRRVLMNDVAPTTLRLGLNDDDPENSEHIIAYNQWATNHEHTMSKSLYSAGTT